MIDQPIKSTLNFIDVDPRLDAIKVGMKSISPQDFSEALWCILAEDHFGFQDKQALRTSSKLAATIRSLFIVDVALAIFRASPTGDENDVIGMVRSRDGQTQITFWASDASGDVELLVAKPGEKFPSTITRLMRKTGANICQISGTDIINKRPNFLTKDELAMIIDQLITDGEIGWTDADDGVATTGEFLDKHYRE
jgi:hypothetical protein